MEKKPIPAEAGRKCTHDHYVPLSKGGLHTYENSVAACLRWNEDKADMLPVFYMARLNGH